MSRLARIAAVALATVPLLARATTGCTVDSVPTASFGAYSPVAIAPLDVVLGSLVYTCTGMNANDTVSITLGPSTNGAIDPRAMRSPGGGILKYQVYLDAARTQPFGDGKANGTTPFIQRNGGGRTLPLYGRIFAQQPVPGGTYGDALTVTFNF